MMTKSWLQTKNIAFIEKHIEDEGVAEELMELGYMVTPVIMINGQTVVGYNTRKLAEALKI